MLFDNLNMVRSYHFIYLIEGPFLGFFRQKYIFGSFSSNFSKSSQTFPHKVLYQLLQILLFDFRQN